ncbi:PAS domain-containing sensor histidine kinase [Sulfurivermis fontis]|uniref:PAS domain-containing sensor histidine kinase n=1 Tax=Sulfurivermis fontis TaxID=1972068 RepID=UPI000FDAE360|nr:PAS domain-containing sensor histidine kinase [Sulfurivermis fontis]
MQRQEESNVATDRRWVVLPALLAAAACGGVLGRSLGCAAPWDASLPFAVAAGLLASGAVLIWCLWRMRGSCRRDAAAVQQLSAALEQSRVAEQVLQRREHFYLTILEDIPEMICRWYPDGRISYVNEAYCRHFQVSREELLRQGGFPLFHPGAGRRDAALYHEQPVVVMEYPVQQDDGSQRWERWVDRALFNDDGSIREFQSVGEDITARKHAEQETARLLEENRRLARMALAIQEEERANLARELHDELGQSLTAIRAEAECVLQLNRDRSALISECASSINAVAGQVYVTVRGMMRRLRPSLLDDLGLVAALEELLQQWHGHHPEVVLESSLSAPPSLPQTVELTAYRIAQEALTNISKHAAASRVTVSLRPAAGRLELCVRDDGVGIDKRAADRGFGLLGMRERALVVGGEFHVSTGPGTGTTVRAVLPLTEREVQDAGRDYPDPAGG